MSDKELTIRIAGEAGQGIDTIGTALASMFKKDGFHIFSNMDYMSRIRGGNNYYQLRVANTPVRTFREKCHLLITLNAGSINLHKDEVNDGGCIIIDREKFKFAEKNEKFLDVPLHSLAREAGGSELYVNSVACGLIGSLTGMDFKIVKHVLTETFKKKGSEVMDTNHKAALLGYNYKIAGKQKPLYKLERTPLPTELLLDGNQAIALGAIAAGCKFYAAYPMTPSTSIMNTIAHYADRYNIVVEQAEDEIAAVNMVIGASFAGVRSMAGTSGGGFALMAEGVSLAGITETAVVIAVAQRPGPATGFPTRTEQGELNFLIHAGHGEFAKAVYSPGTIEEAFYLTIKAFNLAEKYQIPVFIMTDQHLADSVYNIPPLDLQRIRNQRAVLSRLESRKIKAYQRYLLTPDGISPKAIPSWINDVIYADSDEHDEQGHITESAEIRKKMVEKRYYQRLKLLEKEIEPPQAFKLEKAEVVFLGFGSTRNVLKESIELLDTKKAGFIHLPQVWPFPKKQVAGFLENKKRIITVENNAGAQLAGLLKRETGRTAADSILRYDGRPFNLDYLLREMQERI
jgi:2-oxoglutarate ferredoxin oxidoreductase subunit alpha